METITKYTEFALALLSGIFMVVLFGIIIFKFVKDLIDVDK